MADGTRFAVGTGFSDAEREGPPPVGSVITFRFQELSEGGVPRFPSYVGVRDDVKFPGKPAAAAKKAVIKVSAPPAALLTRRFEYGKGKAAKFWEVTRRGSEVTLRFGTAGTPGETKTRQYPDEEAAAEAVADLIADKLDDGFVECAAEAPAAPKARAGSDRGAALRARGRLVEQVLGSFRERQRGDDALRPHRRAGPVYHEGVRGRRGGSGRGGQTDRGEDGQGLRREVGGRPARPINPPSRRSGRRHLHRQG
jgi:predicted DNA-binding WGR domain protein